MLASNCLTTPILKKPNISDKMDALQILHKDNLEQRQRWMLISFGLILVVTLETMVICYLSTQVATKKEVIRYVEFSERGDFGFKVLPESNMSLSQKKLLIEQQLQQYVIDRVSNVASKKSGLTEVVAPKVNFVSALSSREVVNQYSAEVMKIYNESDFTKRDIQILSFSEIENRKYRFDFNTIDITTEGKPVEQRWVVYLKYQLLDPNELKINEHKEINPLGIKITYYRGDVDRQHKIDIKEAVND